MHIIGGLLLWLHDPACAIGLQTQALASGTLACGLLLDAAAQVGVVSTFGSPAALTLNPLSHNENTMIDKLTETLIEYHPDDLDAWKRGEKRKWLDGRTVPPEVYNQPRYHFGEYFVLNYFEKARWHGYCFYSFTESSLEKLKEGQRKIAELFPDHLATFRDIRSRSRFPEEKGEPDLFLYMENGPTLFLEVKKEHDKVSPAQLECLAQIRGILKAEIGIIYLVKHGHQHTPKTFDLDLETFQCRQVIVA